MTIYSEGLIFGACNPLLDISAKVSQDLLKKYDLKPNSAILGEDKHLEIYDDLEKTYSSDLEYIPGGAGQNALRTASWILKHPNVATFVGCIGKDQNADIMKQKANEVGLNAVYQVNDSAKTGTCAVLITGNERSLVAHLGAANHFTVDHLNKPDNWSLIEKAKVFYISGYFFTVCQEAILKIANYALEHKRTFSINLSAPFISQFFKDRILSAIPYVDIIFGNDDEARAFSKNVIGSEATDAVEIAKAISHMEKKDTSRERIVIITQGDKPVVVARAGQVREYPVDKVDQAEIVDTNGAGDAFVGGFLSQYIQGKEFDKCIDCAIWVSTLIIKRHGCTFPDVMTYQ